MAIFGWEASKRVRTLKIEANCDTVPVNLDILTKDVGISRKVEVPLPFNGRLVREKSDIVIEVNKMLSEFQKRQVIAHEIAHLILEKRNLILMLSRGERNRIQKTLPNHVIEKLCDEAASEIILPLYWLRDQLKYQTPSLELIEKIARISETTIDSVAIRIHSKGLWRCRFLWWNLVDGNLFVTDSFPTEPEDILLSIRVKNIGASLIAKSIREQKYLSGVEELIVPEESEEETTNRKNRQEYKVQSIPVSINRALSILIYS